MLLQWQLLGVNGLLLCPAVPDFLTRFYWDFQMSALLMYPFGVGEKPSHNSVLPPLT